MGVKQLPCLVALGGNNNNNNASSQMNWQQKQNNKVVGTKVVLDKLFDFHLLGLCVGDDEWDAEYISDWIETNLLLVD